MSRTSLTKSVPSRTFRHSFCFSYTDGITEAENRQSELWGEQRLENLLQSRSRETQEQIITGILDEVSALADGQPQRDDVTLVVMNVQEGCDV